MTIKFLQGGTFIPPYTVYQPLAVPQLLEPVQGTTSVAKEDKKTNKLLDTIYDAVKDLNGLPGDMLEVSHSLASIIGSIQAKADSPNNIMGNVFNTAAIASDYLKAMNLIKNVKFLRDMYDKSFDNAVKSGGIKEAAINSNGNVLVIDNTDQQLYWKSPESIKKNIKKYTPITNAQLLTLRAKGVGGLAFNEDVFNTISSSIGIKEVTSMILDAVKQLGTNSNSTETYINVQANKLLKGLSDYTKALQKSGNYNSTLLDLYKVKLLDSTLYELAMLALSYVYATLPDNARALLKMKSDLTNTGAFKLMLTLINSKISVKNEFGSDPSSGDAANSKQNSENEGKLDTVTAIMESRGMHPAIFSVNVKGNDTAYISGDLLENIEDNKGNHLGERSMMKLLNDSGIRSIIDSTNGIYFGDLKITFKDLKNIMYKDEGALKVLLPVDASGKPLFGILQKYLKAKKLFEESGNKSDSNRFKIFNSDPELRSLINPDGSLNLYKFKPYLLLKGLTTDKLIGINTENDPNKNIFKNDYVTKLDPNDAIYDDLEWNLTEIINGKEHTPEIDRENWYDFDYDTPYAGILYVPLTNNKNAAFLGGNQKISLDESARLEDRYQQHLKGFINNDISNLK